MPGATEVYVDYWFRLSESWRCDPAGCGKVHFLFPASGGDTYMGIYCTDPGTASCTDPSASDNVMRTGGQLQFHDGAGANYPLGIPIFPNVTTTPIYRGRWHHLEAYYRFSSTKTAADGIWRWWVDGVRNGDYTDIVYSIDPIIEFQYSMTKQRPPDPPEQFVWFDHTTLRAPGESRGLPLRREPMRAP